MNKPWEMNWDQGAEPEEVSPPWEMDWSTATPDQPASTEPREQSVFEQLDRAAGRDFARSRSRRAQRAQTQLDANVAYEGRMLDSARENLSFLQEELQRAETDRERAQIQFDIDRLEDEIRVGESRAVDPERQAAVDQSRERLKNREQSWDEAEEAGTRLIGDPTYYPRAIAGGTVGAAGATLEGAGLLTRFLGADEVGRIIQQSGRDVLDYSQELNEGIPEEARGFGTDVAAGTGSMALYYVPGVASTILLRGASATTRAVAGTAAAGALAGPAGMSDQYGRALEFMSEEEALQKSIQGIPGGLLQVAPVGPLLAKLPLGARSKAVHVAQAFAAEFTAESAGALWQNFIEQSYNEERGIWDDTIYQGLVGGSSAAVINSLISSAGRRGVKIERRGYTQDELDAAAQGTGAQIDTGDIAADQAVALSGESAPAAIPTDQTIAPDQAVALEAADPTPTPDPAAPTVGAPDAADMTRAMVAERFAPQPEPAPQPAPQPETQAALPPEVTPEPVQDQADAPLTGAELAGDTLDTVPETPATIEQQARDMLDPDNARMALFVPRSSIEQEGYTPPRMSRGTRMLRLPDGSGVLYWNTGKSGGLTARDAQAMYNDGLLGQMLGLGPFTKADVAESVARGNPEVAVVERTPEGVEVKAAAGTTETAPQQMAALQADAAPGNTVQVEDPAQVIQDREQGRQSAAAEAAAELSEAQQGAQERRFEVETRRRGIGPRAAQAFQRRQERSSRPGTLSLTPQGSQQAEAPVTEAPVAQEPTPEVRQEGNRRVLTIPTDAETQRQTDEYNARIAERLQARSREEASRATEERAETRAQTYSEINEQVKRGELTPVQEAEARAKAGNKRGKERDAKVEQARIAGELAQKYIPDAYTPAENRGDVQKAITRLNAAVAEARERGYKFGSRVTSDINSNAVVWLHHARMMVGKLNTKLNSGRGITYQEINDFLMAEVALKQGDGDLLRAMRIEAGEQQSGAVGGDTDALVDTSSAAVETEAASLVEDTDRAGAATSDPTDAGAAFDLLSRDDVDIGPNVTASRRGARIGSERGELDTRAEAVMSQLEAMDISRADIRDAIDNEPARARELIEQAERQNVRTISRDDPRFAEIAAAALARESKGAQVKETSKKRSSPEFKPEAKPEPKKAAEVKEAAKKRAAPKKAPPAKPAKKRDAAAEWLAQNDPDVRAMQREGTTGEATAPGDLARNGQERSYAVQESTLSEMQGEAKQGLPLGLRSFTPGQKRQQDAVADALYKRITEVAGDVPVYILDGQTFDRFAPNADAYYNPVGDYIVVRDEVAVDAGAAMHVMLHEGSHAAMEAAMRANPELAAQAEALRVMARDHAKKTNYNDGRYGLSDASEFMAEVWSNPGFREFLASAPISAQQAKELGITGPQRPLLKNMLGWVKHQLAKILNIRQALTSQGYDAGTRSALEAAMDVAGALLEAAPAARADQTSDATSEVLPMAGRSEARRDPLVRKLKGLGVQEGDAIDAARVLNEDAKIKAQVTDEFLAELAERLVAARELSTAETREIEKKQQALAKKLKSQHRAAVKQAEADEKEAGDRLKEVFVPEGKPTPVWETLLKVTSNLQIAEVSERFFGAKNNPVRRIADLMEKRRIRRTAMFNEYSKLVEKQIQAQKNHTTEDWQSFTELAINASSAEVHPDVPLSHPKNKHIQKTGLRDAWKRDQHARLAPRYEAMPQGLKDIYAETRDTLTEIQNRMSLTLMQNVLRKLGATDEGIAKRLHEGEPTAEDRALLGEEVMAHIESVAELKKVNGPYFNFARRGNFVVRGTYQLDVPAGARKIGEDTVEFRTKEAAEAYSKGLGLRNTARTVYVDPASGSRFAPDDPSVRLSKNDVLTGRAEARYLVTAQVRHVEFFERKAEAMERHAELSSDPKLNLKLKGVEKRKSNESEVNAELTSRQMATLADVVTRKAREAKDFEKLNDAEIKELKAMMNEVSLRFLGSTRIQSSRLPRAYVEGQSRDITRNTLDYVGSSSGYLARLETAPDMESALRDLDAQGNVISERNKDASLGASIIRNEMVERAQNFDHTGESAAKRGLGRILSLSYSYYLGSGAYSAINSMQPAMLGIPHLAGQFNLTSTLTELTKAYKDIGAVQIVAGGVADTARAGAGRKINSERFLDDVKSRLSKSEGQMIDELVALGRIDAEAMHEIERVVKQVGWTGKTLDVPIQYFEGITRALPQGIEVINRSVMAVAAYRMHYSRNKDHAAAVAFAAEAVHVSQGQYSNSNAAPVFTNPTGRIALQFMKYPQLVMYMYGRNLRQVVKPLEKGDRAKAIKTLGFLTATHFAAAGAAGMFPWEILKLPLMFFRGLGLTDISWDDVEEEFEEQMRELTGSDYLARLITRGVPTAAGADISARAGLQNMLTFGEPRNYTEEGVLAYLASTAGGAPGGMATNIAKGGAAIADGDVERAMGFLMPMKTLNDAAKAAREYRAGKYTETEALIRTFGLMPSRAAAINRETGAQVRDSRRARDERVSLERRYMRARTRSERIEVERAIQRFNREAGDGRKISVRTLERRRREQFENWNR